MARLTVLITLVFPFWHICALAVNYKKLESQIQTMRKNISQLESRLNRVHRHHERIVGEKKKWEKKEILLNDQLQDEKLTLKEEKEKIEKILVTLVVHSLDEGDIEDILARNIMVGSLQSKKKRIEKSLHVVEELEHTLKSVEARRRDFFATEETLRQFLRELKNRKKRVSDQYLKISRKTRQKNTASFIKEKLHLPLKKYISMDRGAKGITLKFKDASPVYATGKGIIIYTGPLASYGNVIMIDHGRENRSILLGPFVSKVKKGQSVKNNEIIGHLESMIPYGQVYFEVRKKDKVQNTIHLVEDSLIAGNHSQKTNI